eukprot:Skav212965  [mRNA]  locus=scaffold1345:69893:70069:+ [translate_table: standard]
MLRDLRAVWEATIVVDVGGTYEPEKQRFDHHQKTFTETYSEAQLASTADAFAVGLLQW